MKVSSQSIGWPYICRQSRESEEALEQGLP